MKTTKTSLADKAQTLAARLGYELIADLRPRASDTDEQLYGICHKKYEQWVEFDPNNKECGWPVGSKPSYGTLNQAHTWLTNSPYQECEVAAQTRSERIKRHLEFEPLSLDQLAVDIKHEHEAAEASIRDSLMHAREAGDKLMEVKLRLKHGEWMPWVEANCQFSHSTALLYFNVALRWNELANSQHVENLTLHKAAEMLGEMSREVRAAEKKLYSHPRKDKFYDEKPSDRERRLFRQYTDDFLQPDSKEELCLGVILCDHELHHSEIEQTLNVVLELRRRVDTAIEKLRERMALDDPAAK
jgi:hypothetical protein